MPIISHSRPELEPHAMPVSRQHNTSRTLARLLACAVLASTAVLAGCGSNRDGMTTGSIDDDYRTRHPIVMSEVEHALDLPISSAETRLTTGMRDAVGGFANDYRTRSTSTVQIMIPYGAPNSSAAMHLAKQIRATMVQSGVPSSRIVQTSYQSEGQGDAAPIRLTYVAMTAVTNACGQWPEDLANDTFSNRNWQNFGCASQANLAAQIDNPMDLLTPRKAAPIDAARRSLVITTYRAGKNTATTQ